MIKRIFFIATILLLLTNCTSNTIFKKPDNLIPKDTMVALITDMLIAEKAKDIRNLNLEKELNYTALLTQKYNIDSTRFKSSNLYYTSVIEEYEEMFVEVTQRLEALKVELEAAKKVYDSVKRDSLLRIKNKVNRSRAKQKN